MTRCEVGTNGCKRGEAMIQFDCKSHRECLKSSCVDQQKLYVMIKLIPDAETAKARPPLALALVIDTSGSMSGDKIEQAIHACHTVLGDDRLRSVDRVTLVQFNDSASCLVDLGALGDGRSVRNAVDRLRQFSGGTMMGHGLRGVLTQIKKVATEDAKRVLLLTDGMTGDEDDCRSLAREFGAINCPIIATGVGDEYNEKLLLDVAESSLGKPYHLRGIDDFSRILDEEIASSAREVVTDIRLNVGCAKGIRIDSIARVHPSLTEVGLSDQPFRLGNAAAGDYTVFLVEATVAGLARPPSRARVLQVNLTAEVPGLGRRVELPPRDLFVVFSADPIAIAKVDPEVLHYVREKNLIRDTDEAIRLSKTNPTESRQKLQELIQKTKGLGMAAVTKGLAAAADELARTGTISPGLKKTVILGGKTKTVRFQGTL